VVVAGLVSALLGTAHASHKTNEFLNHKYDGTFGKREGNGRVLSADGSLVGITSAIRMTEIDTNGQMDAYVFYRQTGTATRASVKANGSQIAAASTLLSMSDDGHYVIFGTFANGVVTPDRRGTFDYFLKDLQTGTVTRLPRARDYRSVPELSGDGTHVVFSSTNKSYASESTSDWDVFVLDLSTQDVEMVSESSTGVDGNGRSDNASISADGNLVAFESRATNLVNNDTNGAPDVFVHDMTTDTTRRVSVRTDEAEANGKSERPTISRNGDYVLFSSEAANLAQGPGRLDSAYIRDLAAGTTEWIDEPSSTLDTSSRGFPCAVSDSGKYVLFMSDATDLVPNDTNDRADVFLRDMDTGAVTRESVEADHDQATGRGNSSCVGMSADGSVLLMQTFFPLVPGDTNDNVDPYLRYATPESDS
jgi:Tol biopolymer transport system component